MSVSDRWLLPDGVDELLPPEAWYLEKMRRSILDLYKSYGYELVSPPLIEYLESLLTGTGNDLDLQTFKVTDRLTGRLMGVRADITPQVARIDAHMLKAEGVSRLCYSDSVLHTLPVHALTNRCPIQIGCELFGEFSRSADIEVISLMLNTLLSVGVQDMHIDLAHVGIYRGLVDSANFEEQVERKVFDALSRKSIPELNELASTDVNNRDIIYLIRDIANLSGGVEALDKIDQSVRQLSLAASADICSAIAELKSVSDIILSNFENVEVGVDFCELRGYNYHTGLMFSAFSKGYGYALAKGGRYDDIGRGFGVRSGSKPRAATGFSADLKSLVRLLFGESVADENKKIFAPMDNSKELQSVIKGLRTDNCVIQALSNNDTAESCGCDAELVLIDGHWQVKVLSSS